ncbi:hypothetical protein Cycma_3149 [Cyclobacterium marinum DSM 745]|uniref:Uncharacterized protein n=1 Tax=Cyclobacterium marinum (strain ATCC 25205 / DSM 745 / LMG 13164 / NCIMB 1802) TaxID=880070 RepID=G0J6Y6_CYCMS|nr:hypothetical protein Cycma_3149 [Cyclobacterium marinum DSM 745]
MERLILKKYWENDKLTSPVNNLYVAFPIYFFDNFASFLLLLSGYKITTSKKKHLQDVSCKCLNFKSLLSGSNQRPTDYKSEITLLLHLSNTILIY